MAKFTVEPETKDKIPSLDVSVKRHDEGFDTPVYKKNNYQTNVKMG